MDAAVDAAEPSQPPRRGRRRGRRVLAAYLVLLAASALWQLLRPPADPPLLPTGLDRVELVRRGPGGDPRPDAPPVAVAARRGGSVDPAAPLVVLLHGSPGDLTNFNRVQPAIDPSLATLAVDLPGFGASSRAIPDYAPAAHAAYVLDLLDRQPGLAADRPVHVVGYSMGGAVALRMIQQRPDRIASVVMLGATGIQEGEGSGDHDFEHLKYRLGWLTFVALPELVPHFGWLGSRPARQAWIRNFMDSDQRPLRAVLEATDVPILMHHGRGDFLVPPWTAREHHRLAPVSELLMTEGGHFDVFLAEPAAAIARDIGEFVGRVEAGGPVGDRVSDPGWEDHARTAGNPAADLPISIGVGRAQDPWLQMVVVAMATFVSEDLTCIASGLLARQGVIDPMVAILGCTVGIFLGDIGLWLIGRLFGRRALRWPWLARRIPADRVERLGRWLDDHAGRAIITSRFIPGTRLPLYVAAGMLGTRSLRFFAWFLVAALLWTPTIVVLVFLFGQRVVGPLERLLGDSWMATAAAVILLFVLIRVLEMSLTRAGRRRLKARVSRLWRWEFWPPALFYLPLMPWIAWLSLRHRGFNAVTAANPGIPHGGLVGEIKSEILDRMDSPFVLPCRRIEGRDLADRMAAFERAMAELDLAYPVIVKPEVGERGAGVRKVADAAAARRVLAESFEPVLVQRYHAGPHEAGIFYVREPGAERGRIFAVTHKVFPAVTGDGVATLEELIRRHPRYLMQAGTFCRRHRDRLEEVIPDGVSIRLAEAGNHAQGTMFVDGGFLVSPELIDAVDAIARGFRGGFDFGRFDIRYRDQEELRAGRGFGIVELNGVTSEATNLYDPGRGLFAAYRTLYAQWAILFRIGAANRDAGHPVTSHRRIIAMTWNHLRAAGPDPVSD
jgi:membrane protein DedA with SNARE-associated domain/pimeloyl-ACP methyl ester carboxylesterase